MHYIGVYHFNGDDNLKYQLKAIDILLVLFTKTIIVHYSTIGMPTVISCSFTSDNCIH